LSKARFETSLGAKTMQITNRLGAAIAFMTSILPVGSARSDEVVALPWADAKVEKLATLDNPGRWRSAGWPSAHH
jgi:hypothetical protein